MASCLHPGAHLVRHVERIGAWRLEDGEACGLLAVEIEKLAVGLRAELDAADVADARHVAAVAGLDDHRAELSRDRRGGSTRRACTGRTGPSGAGGAPIWPAVTCSLCCCSAWMTSCAVRPRACIFSGIEPDAHRILAGAEHIDVADAGQAGDLVLQPDGRIVAEIKAVEAFVRRRQRHDLQDRRSTSSGR